MTFDIIGTGARKLLISQDDSVDMRKLLVDFELSYGKGVWQAVSVPLTKVHSPFLIIRCFGSLNLNSQNIRDRACSTSHFRDMTDNG
jgi:hypothetical protein